MTGLHQAKWFLGVLVLGAISCPVWAQSSPSNQLAFGAGVGLEDPRPEQVVILDLEYARRLDDRVWLVLRPEYLVDLAKELEWCFGLDLGIRWVSGNPGDIRFGLGGAVGLRLTIGFGAVLRLETQVAFPVVGWLDLVVRGAAEVGRINDLSDDNESADLHVAVRGDLAVGVSFSF